MNTEPIQETHRQKLACIYLRQSTLKPIFDSKRGIRGGNLLKLATFRGFDFSEVKM